MSWAEVKKINSDLQEPLNYDHYITDISIFGAQSFIFSPENAELWDEMALKSRRLYSHRAIHDYIYERLTDKNIDALYSKSGILSDQINAFHFSNLYLGNNAIELIQNLTQASYLALSEKFKQGIQRVAEQFLAHSNGVGKWLNITFSFNNSTFDKKETWAEILEDETLIKLIFENEAAITTVTASQSAVKALVDTTNSFQIITEHILVSVRAEKIWSNAVFNQDFMGAIFQNPDATTAVAKSAQALGEIVHSAPAIAALVANPDALNIIITTPESKELLIQTMRDVSTSLAALTQTETDIASISAQLPNIVGCTSAMDAMTFAHEEITRSMSVLEPLILSAIRTQAAMEVLLSSASAMGAMFSSSIVREAIFSDPAIYRLIAQSNIAAGAAFDNELTAKKITESLILMKLFVSTPAALNAMLKTENRRITLANCSRLQSMYSSIDQSVRDTKWFDLSTPCLLDSGGRICTKGGKVEASLIPNQSLYLSLKIGSFHAGANAKGIIYHLQNNVEVASVTTTEGPVASGAAGIVTQRVCIGGCRLIEVGDSGTWGIYAYAK